MTPRASVIVDDGRDWVEVLADACERTSQGRVAKFIGYSSTVVNQVLKGTYAGNWQAVEQAVRGAFMHLTVDCPVLGELEAHRCIEHQRSGFAPTNPQRVRLFRACRSGCPHSQLQETEL